jgi:hypothetical protein
MKKGEKNIKYFVNLENNRSKKNSVRKIHNQQGKLTSDPKVIIKELENFYVSLYDDNNVPKDRMASIESFCSKTKVPKLTESLKQKCEGKLTIGECFKALQTFECNKTPGNDGLSVEFYRTFWPILGYVLVDSLNCAYTYGELSNTQKQAIIRLVEKKTRIDSI